MIHSKSPTLLLGPLALALILAGVVVAGSGCAEVGGGSYTYVKTISTGERIEVPLANGAPVNAKKGTIEVVQAGMFPRMVDKTKQEVRYGFAYRDSSGVNPKSVRVEDVTDSKSVLLLEDLNPVLDHQSWMGVSQPLTAGDPAGEWLSYLDSNTRIFQVTVTQADGSKVILHQGWSVPAWLKPAIRQAMGLPAVK